MKTPVSDQIRLALIQKYTKDNKDPHILGFESGTAPGVIIFNTMAGPVPCAITQDESYIYFQTFPGKNEKKVLKEPFLKKYGIV